MCADAVTEKNRPFAVVPPVIATGARDVKAAVPLPGYRVHVTFDDGTAGIVDLSARIASKQAGVFAQLRDSGIFNQVFVMYGAVTWPGEIDLAPDAVYAAVSAAGSWYLK